MLVFDLIVCLRLRGPPGATRTDTVLPYTTLFRAVTIDVLPTDTLQDLVDRINNANTGAEATGVTASIVRVSASESYMALTVDKAGESLGTEVALADPAGVLGQLGVLDGGGFANAFQAARKAPVYAPGPPAHAT